MDKWQKRMEKVTANAVWRALQKQKNDFQKYLREVGLPNDAEIKRILWYASGGVVEAFIRRSKTTLDRAYKNAWKSWPIPLIWIDWALPAHPAPLYINALKDLHLSERKWSISATTEERVKKLVRDGLKDGMSRAEIAKNIEKLDPQVFSKNRSDLIAINQIHKAQNYGEYIARKEFHDAGYLVLKYWSTANDNRVTRTHTANQSEGWKWFDKTFSGTGDTIPPASDNPRCRCVLKYEIGELRGEKQPKDIEQKYESGQIKARVTTYFSLVKEKYKYENDIYMQNSMTNWKWSPAEFIQELSDGVLTHEESVAISWWKGSEYININNEIEKWITNWKHSGIIMNLESAVYALSNYRKPVFHGTNNEEFIKKLENLEKWNIFSPNWFFATSKNKKKAQERGDILIKINNPKTGWDLWKIDAETIEEFEVLFTPHLTLEFVKKIWNTFIFNEI